MSEVRGKCEFCVHWPPTGGCLLPDYACIDHEQDSPQWTPTSAAQIALRLEADLAAARAELEKHQPEERVGECGCDPERAMGWVYGVLTADNDVCTDWDGCITSGCPRDNDGDWPQCSTIRRISPTWFYAPDPDWGMDSWGGRHPKFCPECGWRLCSDGIARRNADTARVQRVRKLLDTPVPRGVPGAPSPYMQPGIEFAIKKVRAALDGPDTLEVKDDAKPAH